MTKILFLLVPKLLLGNAILGESSCFPKEKRKVHTAHHPLDFLCVPTFRLGHKGQQGPMNHLDQHQETKSKPDRKQMKSLSFGMVSDISRLLADKGFGPKPIDIVEALVFAMFIIADTYSLAKPDKDEALEVIHGFYDDMQDYFIRKVIIGDHQVSDAAEIEAVGDKFHDLSRSRYAQYGEKFHQDISDPMALSCPATVSYFLDNLFIQPITNQEKLQLMGAVSDKVLYFWTGCI